MGLLEFSRHRLLVASMILYLASFGVGFFSVNHLLNTPSPTEKPLLSTYPDTHIIPLRHHTFQVFNNCGPASLSMALSYFEVNISQIEIGNDLRPYQNSAGDKDDKSTTLEELAAKAEELGFISYHRPNGNEDILKKFISNDVPVITRTLTSVNEDIGHYRVVRGYAEDSYIQDDSLQGKDLIYSIEEFNKLWKTYNYEYLVFVPKEKQELAEQILGEEAKKEISWQKAVTNANAQLNENPNDTYARFNLSVAYHNVGEYQKSIDEFEKIENQLSFRTLWYQIEPIESYYEAGDYERVFEITDRILNNQNRAFSELYIIRGNIYKNQGNFELAKDEYEKAVLYNSNLKVAKELLKSVS